MWGWEQTLRVYQIDTSEEHGEILTRRWVVEIILDLAGFTADRDLGGFVAVETFCGAGAFSCRWSSASSRRCQRHDRPLTDIRTAPRAFDLLPANAELAQKAVAKALVDAGLADLDARSIAADCIRCDDFLLSSHDFLLSSHDFLLSSHDFLLSSHDFLLSSHDIRADFVLGNPPYIGLEDVPAARSAAYRRACPTMRGRSDIFVGFIETGLRLLGPNAGGLLLSDVAELSWRPIA